MGLHRTQSPSPNKITFKDTQFKNGVTQANNDLSSTHYHPLSRTSYDTHTVKSKVPPIYLNSATWRYTAKMVYKSEYFPTEKIQAKNIADNLVRLQPTLPTMYKNVQTTLRDYNIILTTIPCQMPTP